MRFNIYTIICAWLIIVSTSNSIAKAQEISEDDLRTHIKILASDEFEGRQPGTQGGIKTVHYLAQQWFDAGYIGGAKDGSFYQSVPLVKRLPQSHIVTYDKNNLSQQIGSNEIALIGKDAVEKFSSATIFGGYGIKDDGSAIDNVRGKAVFILGSNPPFIEGESASVIMRSEKLANAGAAAVIIILSEDSDWRRFSRFLTARPVSLQSSDNAIRVNGLASFDYGKSLAKTANMRWKQMLKAADDSRFNGMDMGLSSNWNVLTSVHKYNSYNVIAKLPGTNPDTGSVFFTGHWDHFGYCRPEGEKDRICNGAIDNASGMSVLIEVAKHLGKKKFDRDIYFVGTTAEEDGLLGAYHMVDNPPVDIKKIVIALNVDTIAIAPKDSKVAIIGRGTTDLDPIIEKIAVNLGREIESSTDANAFIRRQDGWALASKGVPALMVGGSFSDLDLLSKFLSGDYHGVNDEYNEVTELGGAAEDAILHIRIAEHFANITTYSGIKGSE